MSQYQQPYQGYQQQQQQMQPAGEQQRHTVKFYKTWFIFSSLAGKLERDLPSMEAQGWRLQFICKLGMNLFLRRVIVTIWTR